MEGTKTISGNMFFHKTNGQKGIDFWNDEKFKTGRIFESREKAEKGNGGSGTSFPAKYIVQEITCNKMVSVNLYIL